MLCFFTLTSRLAGLMRKWFWRMCRIGLTPWRQDQISKMLKFCWGQLEHFNNCLSMAELPNDTVFSFYKSSQSYIVHSTVRSTVHRTVHSTVHCTVHSTIHSTHYSTVHSTVHSTQYSTQYSTVQYMNTIITMQQQMGSLCYQANYNIRCKVYIYIYLVGCEHRIIDDRMENYGAYILFI